MAQAAADPSRVLKNTGEMNHDILHRFHLHSCCVVNKSSYIYSNLILFLQLCDFYELAELKEIVEEVML